MVGLGGWVGAGRLATVKGVGCWGVCEGLLGVVWYGMVGGSKFRRLGKIGDAFSKEGEMD